MGVVQGELWLEQAILGRLRAAEIGWGGYVMGRKFVVHRANVTRASSPPGVLRRAVVWRLIRTNPIASIDRPSVLQPEISVLPEAEIARLMSAYDELLGEASEAERPWWLLAKAITALGTALRRGELIGPRWRSVNLLEAKVEIRETFVRGRFTTPKSKASRRVIELGPRTLAVLEDQWRRTAYRGDDDLVFGHPMKGTPVDTSKLAKRYLKPALKRVGIEKQCRPFHDLGHTSLTHAAAAGNPQIYVQARAGHSQGSITERYMHAAQVLFRARRSGVRSGRSDAPADNR
ncbi:MAG: tyrosine-type recombinase/integrase [Thermoleophilaceae bacterium]